MTRANRLRGLRVAYALVLATACSDRREASTADRVPAAATTPKGDAPRPVAAQPPTREPSGKVQAAPYRYDPRADPANRTGFRLGRHRPPNIAADAKKPLDITAFYRVAEVADPRISPDGKTILFTVTRSKLSAGTRNTDIYRIDANGQNLRRLTRDQGADFGPRWAPDGKSFLFISVRSRTPQVYRMAIDGGEPEQLTTLSTGASHAEWVKGGTRIVLTTRVFPEHGANDAANKALLADIKASPFKGHLADDLLYRHWTYYKDGRKAHVLLLDLKSGKLTDLTAGNYESPAFGEHPGYTVAPEGGEVCYVSNHEAASARAFTTNKDLWVAAIDQRPGPARSLTPKNKAYDGDPTYSPDGRSIAFRRQAKPGYEADRFRLALYDRKSGDVRVLTESYDGWVLSYRFSPDAKSIVFRTAERGRFPLLRINLESGAITKLALPSVRDYALAPDGRVVFTHSSVSAPSELYLADARGQHIRRLTFFNQRLVSEHDIRPLEELWLPGATGRNVHTFIVKPHGYKAGRRYPLIVNVHGGPQYQWADTFRGDWQIYPAYGYVVAYLNPHGSIGYGQAYCDAIARDYGGKVYQDVMRVTDALAKLPYVDNTRIGAMGWSYGGYMMAWLLGHTRRFRAIASMMGVYDLPSFYGATDELWFPEHDLGGTPWKAQQLYRRFSPSSYADRFATPTLVITGERDYRVPYTQSLQLFTALRRRNVPARLIVLPNDGHWPHRSKSMPIYYTAHVDWFHRYLGGRRPEIDLHALLRGRAFKK